MAGRGSGAEQLGLGKDLVSVEPGNITGFVIFKRRLRKSARVGGRKALPTSVVRLLDWLSKQRRDKPFVYVPGNHEFYGHDVVLTDELKNEPLSNVHVLDNDELLIDSTRFLGCVLWTDFQLFGEVDKWFSTQRARQIMNDFFVIRCGDRRFTPADSIALHELSRRWLSEKLTEPFGPMKPQR